MTLLVPIAGLCPPPEKAADVAELPYDVMDRAEAAQMAVARPDSFLHVSRPEIDLPDDVASNDPRVYQQAARALAGLRNRGVLVRATQPAYYAYRLTRGEHRQTGVVGGASVAAYVSGRIARHELTRPAKQADRAAHIAATNAQTGPALLVHPRSDAVAAVLTKITETSAPTDFIGPGGTRHEVWTISDTSDISQIATAFAEMPRLYIADGHHRSAAAAAVHAQRGNPADGPSSHFLAVCFPADELRILAYNRVVRDLSGHTAADFLDAVGGVCEISEAPAAVAPYEPGTFGMYLPGQWYSLRAAGRLTSQDDPVRRLDVSLLQDQLLEPLLGIADPRTDTRIDFVGGVRGLGELVGLVDSGRYAVAFSLHPTAITDLIAVADAGSMMPPKSTWFEPKLVDGLVSNILD